MDNEPPVHFIRRMLGVQECRPCAIVAVSVAVSVFFTLACGALGFFVVREYYPHILSMPEPQNLQETETAQQVNSEQVVDIVGKSADAVVSVVITQDVPIIERYFEEYNPFGGPFGFQIPRERQRGTEKREVGGGTGFFVSADGLLVTNRHVVDIEDAEYTVLTNAGEKLEAEVVARDPVYDIAVLKVKGDAFTFLRFADSDGAKLGQTVIAIGNALAEFRNSVSVGVVSGLSRSIVASDGRGMSEELKGVIQTDAAINPGNSGGPLLDLTGKVLGVNVAVAGGAENIGFALPANIVQSVVASVEEFGSIKRPYLGVRYIEVNEELAEAEGLEKTYGALVRSEGPGRPAVVKDSPAHKAGLRSGDHIVAVGGVELSGKSLAEEIRTRGIGDTVVLTYYRAGEERTVDVTLTEMPSE